VDAREVTHTETLGARTRLLNLSGSGYRWIISKEIRSSVGSWKKCESLQELSERALLEYFLLLIEGTTVITPLSVEGDRAILDPLVRSVLELSSVTMDTICFSSLKAVERSMQASTLSR
jgi:hypothetical protein